MDFFQSVEAADGAVLVWIQQTFVSEWLTPVMKFFSFIGEYGWAAILFCMILILCRKTRRLGILCAASLAFAFILCNLVIKPLVLRPRPWEVVYEVQHLLPDSGDGSFPSGHSMNYMATAFSFWLNTKKEKNGRLHRWSCAAIVITLLIAFSRLYLGMHFPTDVVTGLLLGMACAEIVYIVYRKIEHKNAELNII